MNPTGFADQVASVSLPSGWAWARLADIARINPALDIRITHDARAVTFVPMAAVDEGFGGVQRPQVRTFGQVKKGYTPFQMNDVIMAKITPCMENGKGGVVRGRDGEVYFGSTEFHVLRARAGVLPEWIGSFLAQERIRRAARLGMKGSAGQLRVPEEFFERLYFPLPPFAEQQRIVDRIDELFTDLAAGVAALERVKRNLSRYRAAVLHAAVTGRLTEGWRKQNGSPAEPGPKLLERILVERRRQWEERTLAKYEREGKQPPRNWRSRYPEPFSPGTLAHGAALPGLPDSWCWATHDQVGDVQLGRQRAPQHHTGSHMRPYLRVANVYEDRIDTNDVLQMNFTPEEFETYALRHGDILLNEGQSMELVGRPAMYRDELPGGCFQNTLVRQRAINPLVPEFALIVCLAQFRAGRFRKIASITTSIAHLGAQRFAALEFPLPPVAEQEVIIDTVKEKLSLIDALTLEVQRGHVRAGRLRQSILKAAFEGALVPQDPADELASVLLERIKQQAATPMPTSNGDGHAANGTVPRRRGRPSGSRQAAPGAAATLTVSTPAKIKRSRKVQKR